MKIVPAILAFAALIFVSASCDKHSWEETKVLHEGMHKEGHGDAHHGKAEEHAKPATHAPEAIKPAAH